MDLVSLEACRRFTGQGGRHRWVGGRGSAATAPHDDRTEEGQSMPAHENIASSLHRFVASWAEVGRLVVVRLNSDQAIRRSSIPWGMACVALLAGGRLGTSRVARRSVQHELVFPDIKRWRSSDGSRPCADVARYRLSLHRVSTPGEVCRSGLSAGDVVRSQAWRGQVPPARGIFSS